MFSVRWPAVRPVFDAITAATIISRRCARAVLAPTGVVAAGATSVAPNTGDDAARRSDRRWRATYVVHRVHCRFGAFLAVFLALGISAFPASVARAQCTPQWLPGEGLAGTDLSLDTNSVTTWDPDGAGPQPTRLVIGGGFDVAGSTNARGIAMWNGIAWETVGNATDLSATALAVYNGDLFVGGLVTMAGSPHRFGPVARLVGNTWQQVGPLALSSTGQVRALMVHNGELIVGGQFTSIGGISANNIARWNGTLWQTVGTGVDGGVFSLGDFNNELIVGGQFNNAGGNPASRVARWDGAAWRPLGDGIVGTIVRAFTTFNSELIAGGTFTSAGGTAASNIARWNGTAWQTLGSGVVGGLSALTVYRNELLVGGLMSTAGDVSSPNGVARWNGTTWQAVPGNPPAVGCNCSDVRALAALDGELFMGGNFISLGGIGAKNIAGWNGATSTWRALGVGVNGVFIRALTSYAGDLIVGGDFRVAGGTVARSVARWNGISWQPLGAGLSDPPSALTVYNGDLIAGGGYIGPNFTPPIGVGRWDGTAWQPMGLGLPGAATTFATYNGELIAGGGFSIASGGNADYVARWNGTSWQPVGTGMAGPQFFTLVVALAVYNGELIAGGRFTSAGGVPAANIARWNGSAWLPLGSGLPGPGNLSNVVSSLTVWGNELVAAGSFTTAAGAAASGIARWNGTTWQPFPVLPPFSPISSSASAVTVYGGNVVVAGPFQVGSIAPNVITWTGTTWESLGTGVNQAIFAFTEHRGELVAGGLFSIAGGGVAGQWARWTNSGAPWAAIQPQSQSVQVGAPLSLASVPANGFSGVSYQWQRNGAAVANGPSGVSPGGGTVSGASGTLAPSDAATLTITNTQASDAGAYTVVFTNPCGSTTSSPAIIAVSQACGPADFDGNGAVEPADVSLFVNVWFTSLIQGTLAGDFDGNGNVEPADVSLFVTTWFNALVNGC